MPALYNLKALSSAMTDSEISFPSVFLFSLIWLILNTTRAPNKGYKLLLPAEQSILDLFVLMGLLIAPGLLTSLEADSPTTSE